MQWTKDDKKRTKGIKRRRRLQRVGSFFRKVVEVIVAIVVGLVAGTALYLLANAGILKLIDEPTASTPAPATATPAPEAPTP